MKSFFSHEKEIAFQAVKEAASFCQQIHHSLPSHVVKKADQSPVTIADYGCQALICKQLNEAFPKDPIIAEENSSVLRGNHVLLERINKKIQTFYPNATADHVCNWIDHGGYSSYSDRFWTLDPVDGTKGFLRGDQYAIALALIINGESQIAALACPNLRSVDGRSSGSIFLAERHVGAMEYSLDDPHLKFPIKTSDISDHTEATLCESVESGHSSHTDTAKITSQLEIRKKPLRLDSQVKYAIVARGQADIYLRLPTQKKYREKIWDHASGWLIVIEAGGMVTDMYGQTLDFTKGNELTKNRGIVVTNGHLHDVVLQSIARMNPDV